MGSVSHESQKRVVTFATVSVAPTADVEKNTRGMDDAGNTFNFNGTAWVQTGTNGNAHVVDGITGIPRFQVTPTVAGVSTSELIVDAGATNQVLGIRASLAATDLVTAGDAIKNRYPDVARASLKDSNIITSDSAITALYVCGIGDATNAAGKVISTTEATDATIRSAITLFEFSPTDDVRTVVISFDEPYTSQQLAIARVEGYSYA